MTGCPDESELVAFAQGRLEGSGSEYVERHVDDCGGCFAALAASLEREAPDGSEPPPIAVESSERYVLLEPLGRGAMSVVHAAYDRTLDRRVALKLLEQDGLEARVEIERVLREAQAQAKLSHPNVVPIYDVGLLHGDRPFISMEFVEGDTARHWLSARRRPWPEVLDVLILAGRALAAAHISGVVHRDFKPSNVIVGGGGVVKVLDFGLAKMAATRDPESGLPVGGFDSEQTRTGALVGTPAYMAPEQLRGEPAGRAADQFAFCVVLHEALYGDRPFRATDRRELAAQIRSGLPRENEVKVPRWLRQALARGLAYEAEARWPTMGALVAFLERHRSPKTRWAWAVGLGLAAGAGLLAFSVSGTERVCSGAEAEIGATWSEERRATVRDAVLATDLAYADAAWERTRDVLDAYATDWATLHEDVCEATAVRREQSEDVLDLRMRCLGRARVRFDAIVGVLSTAESDTVLRAHEVVAGLRPLDRCSDVAALSQEVAPPDDEEQERVARARAEIERAAVEHDAGHFIVAKQQLADVRESMQGLEYPPIHTELAFAELRVFRSLDEVDAAEQAGKEVLRRALALDQRAMLQRAATHLMLVVGLRRGKPDEAMRYLEIAQGAADEDPGRLGRLEEASAAIAFTRQDFEIAAEHARNAVRYQERASGPDGLAAVSARSNLGLHAGVLGRYAESERHFRRAVRELASMLGDEHPVVGSKRLGLCMALQQQGRHDEAEIELEAAIRIQRRSIPDESSLTGYYANFFAQLRRDQGRLGEAEVLARQAVENATRNRGERHPDVAGSLDTLGVIRREQGDAAESERLHRRALEMRRETLDSDDIEMSLGVVKLARAIAADDARLEEAEALLRGAVSQLEEVYAPDHPTLAESRTQLGHVLRRSAKLDDARATYEEAWRHQQREDLAPRDRADVAFGLARALPRGERARARSLAELAEGLFERGGAPGDALEVRAWLDANNPSAGRAPAASPRPTPASTDQR